MTVSQCRENLLKIYTAAISSVSGFQAVVRYLTRYPLYGQYHLVAIGKAASSMTRGAMQLMGDKITAGLVITKHGHLDDDLRTLPKLHCIESDHPVPSEASLHSGKFLIDFISRSPSSARFLFLISGGASSLVEVLPPGIGLDTLKRLNTYLLASGLSICEMNQVRSALSMIKGGRLAGYLQGRSAMSLMISDVPNDDPAIIGSGLLVNPSTFTPSSRLTQEIKALLNEVKLPSVIARNGYTNVSTQIIATLEDAKQVAAISARELGYAVRVHGKFLEGETMKVATYIASQMHKVTSGIHIWGGETSVKLPSKPGRGGRNQHLALALALELAAQQNLFVLAVGTDGTDGPTINAGALIDGETISRAERLGLDARQCLKSADAGRFLEASGDLITTGPTGTNVMDLVIALKSLKCD